MLTSHKLLQNNACFFRYDVVFSANYTSREGFVAIDNVTVHHTPCTRPQSYYSGFDEPALSKSSFFVFGE